MVTGASGETRTVADPLKAGLVLILTHKTDGGGDAVVTFSTACNQTGNNTATFADAGDIQVLVSVANGTSGYMWREVANDGAALSTV
jgi:hypothetical protein